MSRAAPAAALVVAQEHTCSGVWLSSCTSAAFGYVMCTPLIGSRPVVSRCFRPEGQGSFAQGVKEGPSVWQVTAVVNINNPQLLYPPSTPLPPPTRLPRPSAQLPLLTPFKLQVALPPTHTPATATAAGPSSFLSVPDMSLLLTPLTGPVQHKESHTER